MGNQNLMILGCPRSGTSLLANLIKSAGYDVDLNGSKPLMKPNALYNPDGYFERIDLVKLNDLILSEFNLNFLSSITYSKLIELINYKGILNNKNFLDNFINEQKNFTGRWALKDSRLCFTLPFYDELDFSIIKVVRNKDDVKNSMINHYGNIFSQDNIIHGPHIIKKLDFEHYYLGINLLIDLYKLLYFKRKFLEIKYEDLLQGKVDELENFIDGSVDLSIIKPQYRNYGV